MKIKLFCLILILSLSLAALPGTARANMLLNPSFEADENSDDWPDDWSGWNAYWSYYGDGYQNYRENDPCYPARTGEDCVDVIGTDYALWYQDQDYPVVGQTYYHSFYAKDVLEGGSTAGIDPAVEFWSAPRGSGGIKQTTLNFAVNIPNDGEWHLVSSSVVIPAGTGMVNPIPLKGGGAGHYLIDDVWFGTTPRTDIGASDPVPPHNSSVVPGLDILRWRKPATRCPDTYPVTSDIYFDPNIIRVENMDPAVRINGDTPQEPNWIALDPCDVQSEMDYYWRVVSFDPNCGEYTYELKGPVWHFTTINLTPVVNAGLNQSVWLSGGSASVDLTGVITDDGLPNPPESVNYTWSKTSGPALASNSNPSGTVPEDGIVPTTVGFNTAGTYVLKLEGDDDKNNVSGGLGKTGSDTVKVFVYDAAPATMLVGYWPFDVATQFNDTSGNGHHGTPQDNAQIDSSDFQIGTGSLLVDGDGDYVDCGGGTTDPNFTTWASPQDPNRMSVTCWMKSDFFGKQWANLVSKGALAWRLQRNSSTDNVEFAVDGIGVIGSGDSPTIDKIDDGKWHHIAGVVMEDAIYLYVDGILAGVTEGGPVGHGGHELWIGKGYNPGNTLSHEFSGNIDEVRLYQCPLNTAKVLEEYIAGGGSNSCGGNYDPADFNQDCYVTLEDFAILFEDWFYCNDVANPGECNL